MEWFKPPHEVDRLGYPVDPTLNELQSKLGYLASEWRGTHDNPDRQSEIVEEYHAIMAQLYELGWDDILDVDAELPDELLPLEYTKRHPPIKSGSWY